VVTALVTAALVTTAMTPAAGMAATFMAAAHVSRRDRMTAAAVGETGMAARITAAPRTWVAAMKAMPAIAAAPAISATPSISAPVITWAVPAALVPTIVTSTEREKLAKDDIEAQARECRRGFLGDNRLSHRAAGQ